MSPLCDEGSGQDDRFALTIVNTSSKIDVGNLNPSWEVAKNITHGDGANFKGLNLRPKHWIVDYQWSRAWAHSTNGYALVLITEKPFTNILKYPHMIYCVWLCLYVGTIYLGNDIFSWSWGRRPHDITITLLICNPNFAIEVVWKYIDQAYDGLD